MLETFCVSILSQWNFWHMHWTIGQKVNWKHYFWSMRYDMKNQVLWILIACFCIQVSYIVPCLVLLKYKNVIYLNNVWFPHFSCVRGWGSLKPCRLPFRMRISQFWPRESSVRSVSSLNSGAAFILSGFVKLFCFFLPEITNVKYKQ